MYMMIATVFAQYPKNKRMSYVKKYYDAISRLLKLIFQHLLWAVLGPIRQYASCVLVDVDDTLPSIFSSDMAIGRYVAQRAGSELTQEESEVSTHVLEAVRYNIRVLFLSQKI